MTSIHFEKVVSTKDIHNNVNLTWARELGDYLVYFVKTFILVCLFYLIIKGNVFDTFQVDGKSMAPNYKDEEKVYIDKATPKFSKYERGDVIIVKMPIEECGNKNPGQTACFFIKRIIGLPGEQVSIKAGEVFIINQEYPKAVKLDETAYLSKDVKTYKENNSGTSEFKSKVLSDNEYFALGDNRIVSKDSRFFGPITKDMIEGKEFYRPDEGFFKLPTYNIPNN